MFSGGLLVYSTGAQSTVEPVRKGWGAYLVWAWMLATFATFRLRSVTELSSNDALDAQVMFQVASWFCFGLIAIWAIVQKRADLSLVRRGPLKWYLGFILMALVSSTYSPLPTLSAFTALQHGVALVLVITLGDRLRDIFPFVVIYVLLNWTLVILGALHVTFGMSWITPPNASQIWTDEEGWRFASSFGHPSQIGIVAATAAFMLPSHARPSAGRVVLMMLTVCTLFLTISRTAIAGFAAGIVFLAASRRRLILSLCIAGSILTLAILIEPTRELIWFYLTRSQSTEDITSLTGRMPLYEDAMSRIKDHWVLGQGFLSSRVLLLNDQGNGNGTVHPHNMLLAAVTGMGVVGGAVALGSICSLLAVACRLLVRTRHHPSGRWDAFSSVAAILPLLAFSILDAGFVSKLNPFVLLYLTVAARTQALLNSAESLGSPKI